MSIEKALDRIGIVLVTAVIVILAGCGSGGGGGKSALVGRWDLVDGPTRGNPEKMELLSDGTGIVDGGAVTYKTEKGRCYLVGTALGKASSYSYTLSGPTLTLTKDDGVVLKYVKKGHQQAVGGSNKVASSGKGKSFTDARDKQKYRTVKIGNQVWMAENLNFEIENSWCFKSDCAKYGRVYIWGAAKRACPKGWHLPSIVEWDSLVDAAGGSSAGESLKSKMGWGDNGNGTDDFGFSALPGGGRGLDGSFNYVGIGGYWWCASAGFARDMNSAGNEVYVNIYAQEYGFSVRCVKD